MGNKSTTQNDSKETPIKPPPISRKSFELFLQCLNKLPFKLAEEQFEDIIYDLEEKTYPENTTVLKAGQPALGIFVIVEGCCNVLASNGLTVINQLKKHDIFGEISSLYDIPCTCTVQVDVNEECRVVFLEYSKIKNMVCTDRDLVPMEKWFIKQSYIDCSSLFSLNQVSKIVIQNQMLHCPLFHGWTEDAISYIYDQLQKESIEIYQPGVCLTFENDEEMHIMILLKGAVELIKDQKHIASFSSVDGCFCFHDDSLFVEDAKQLFTIKSTTTCQIVTFTQEHFQAVMENFAMESSKLMGWCHRWNTFYENTTVVMDNYSELVYHPLLICTLKETELFSSASHTFLCRLILGTVFKIHDKNSCILEVDSNNRSNKIIVLLIKGSAEVFDGSKNQNLASGDLFYFHASQSGSKYIKAITECVVGYISSNLTQTIMSEFPEMVISLDW